MDSQNENYEDTYRGVGELIDVSDAVRRRKRILRANVAGRVLATFLGLLIGLAVGAGLGMGDLNIVFMLAFAWLGSRLAGRLRLGDARVALGLLALLALEFGTSLVGVPMAAAGRSGPIFEGLFVFHLGFHQGFGGRLVAAADPYSLGGVALLILPVGATWRFWRAPLVVRRLRIRVLRLIVLSVGSFMFIDLAASFVWEAHLSGMPDWAIGILGFQLPIAVALIPGALTVLRERRQVGRLGEQTVLLPPAWETPSAVKNRRLFTGRRPVRVSIFLLLTVLCLVPAVSAAMSGNSTPTTEEEEQVLLYISILGLVSGPLAILFYTRARRHAQLGAVELRARDVRPPVLYLRSFQDDKLSIYARRSPRRSWFENAWSRRYERFEEVLVWGLWKHGPVVAVGRPGERSTPLGSAREYLPDDQWQLEVEDRLKTAQFTVLVLGHTRGLEWEVHKLAALGLSAKALIVFPPVAESEMRERLERFSVIAEEVDWPRPDPKMFTHALIAIMEPSSGWRVFTGRLRDEWHYELAIEAAARLAALQPTGSPSAPSGVTQSSGSNLRSTSMSGRSKRVC